MDEEEFFRRGAEFFNKDYDKLEDKQQFKECYFLNTALWWFRENHQTIRIFTSCIASEEYLRQLFRDPVSDVEIYYCQMRASLSNVQKWADERGILLRKIDGDSKWPFDCPTVVFAGTHTTIFDPREFGKKKYWKGSSKVYRDSSRNDYVSYIALVRPLLDKTH